jgi:hypothetical protein
MCALCRIVGRNIFQDVGGFHDEFDDEGVATEGAHGITLWYVWRRGDSMVGVTDFDPRETAVDTRHAYHVLGISTDEEDAHAFAAIATSCN